ncbi:hypothetical protein [Sulfitobacter sp. S190]|uniref:hypothetical protein n=1 Tax=Sulfitobacter sp. S190 TaxID=2867022 RepID=UPI0021A5FE95|nr:hypothetical protein [Sulfitobacter sp. S190]UWR22633.1 hypothetical protein K3756_01150 [Sulfitobacter sp. S190]
MQKSDRHAKNSPALQHEAGDRAFVFAQQLSEFLVEHPFVQAAPHLKHEAEEIERRLADLYQRIWTTEI